MALLGVASVVSTDLVKELVEKIPPMILSSLKLAGSMLPAIGFATILSVMARKELIPYMGFGYVAMALLKTPNNGSCNLRIYVSTILLQSK